jgi:archaemetzincin
MVPDGLRVAILPLGSVESEPLQEVCLAIEKNLGLECTLMPQEEIPHQAFDGSRSQYFSYIILEALSRNERLKGHLVLAVTEVDLRTSIFSFVFGEAQVKGRCAIVSLNRLREEKYGRNPDPAIEHFRLRKEALHEIGHVLGLIHCRDACCVMYRSTTLSDTDYKRDNFCSQCRRLLDLLFSSRENIR